MSADGATLWGMAPALAILIAAALPTHIWRWLGVVSAGRLDETSEVFIYVKAVATAIVAALIAKLVVFPEGPLATIPIWARVGGAALGFAAYLVSGRRLAAGIIAGEITVALAFLTLR
ncbi:MAG: AzlD domain-containing protein [Pseudomonadota bacterium]